MTSETPKTPNTLSNNFITVLFSRNLLAALFDGFIVFDSIRSILVFRSSLGSRLTILAFTTTIRDTADLPSGFVGWVLLTKRESRLYTAKVPPSPSSSASSTISAYFNVTIKANVHRITDSEPRRSSYAGSPEVNVELKTYKGEVPMSPYMTPMD